MINRKISSAVPLSLCLFGGLAQAGELIIIERDPPPAAPVAAVPTPAAAPAAPAAAVAPTAATARVAPGTPPATPTVPTVPAAPAAAAPAAAPSPPSPIWAVAAADEMLSTALARWSRSAGWQLAWHAPRDLPAFRVSYEGSFEFALEHLMRDTQHGAYPLHACIYDNKVVRVLHISQSCAR